MKRVKNLLLVFIFMFSCVFGAYFSINREKLNDSVKDTKMDAQTYLDLELKNIEVFADVLVEE